MNPHLEPNLRHYQAKQRPPVYIKTGPTPVVRRASLWGTLAGLALAFAVGFVLILLVLTLHAQ